MSNDPIEPLEKMVEKLIDAIEAVIIKLITYFFPNLFDPRV